MTRRPSTIDKLPRELRELIGRQREDGHSIDQIRDKLLELDADVSRSALGRHVKTLAEVGERMRRSRVMAEALTAKFGDEPDHSVSRLNFELMHGMVFEMLMAAGGSEDDGEEGEDGKPVVLDAKQVRAMAGALKDLEIAQRSATERTLKLRTEFAKEAAAKVDSVGKARGLTAETVEALKHAVLGVPS